MPSHDPTPPAPVPAEVRRAAAAVYAAGRRAHAGIEVDARVFEAHAVRCANRRLARRSHAPTEGAVALALGEPAAEELYLVAACLADAPDAWERLREHLAPRLTAFARSRGASAHDAEQETTDLLSDLRLPQAESRSDPLLAAYDGSGSLFGWSATCLLRRLGARARREERLRGVHAEAAARLPASRDPADAAERSELEEHLRHAIRGSVEALTPQERAAVVLSHRDGWSGREVARILGVGAPRASRLRTRATEKLRAALVPVLKARGLRPPHADTWEALSAAVGRALSDLAIPEGAAPLRGGHGPRERGSDG